MLFLFLLFIECTGKLVEPLLPDTPIVGDPDVEFLKRLRSKGIEALLPLRADIQKTRLMQYPQMPRHTGLMNFNLIYQIVDGLLAFTERFDDT